MTITVIIPTYNGALKLPGILQCIAAQTVQPEEVLVVVDGSTDNTLEVLERKQKELPALRWVIRANGGRSAVRNTGAHEARGELLVFFDDDMLPEPGCLAVHLQHHATHGGSILTGAQIDLHTPDRSDIQCFKAFLSARWSAPLQGLQGKPLAEEAIFITAANCSVQRELLLQLGGFDEQLTDAEDFDLAVRAYNHSVPLYYNHEAFAWHNDIITGAGYIRRMRQYKTAHATLLRLKPELYRDVPQLNAVPPVSKKRALFRVFARSFWIRWLDNGGGKALLPQKLRYRLYDWIITANSVYFPEKVSL